MPRQCRKTACEGCERVYTCKKLSEEPLIALDSPPVLKALSDAKRRKPLVSERTDSYSRLKRAIEDGNKSEVVKLLKQGADPNSKSPHGYTVLMCAAEYGQDKICKLLLSKGARFDDRTETGWTALLYAVAECGRELSATALTLFAAYEGRGPEELPRSNGDLGVAEMAFATNNLNLLDALGKMGVTINAEFGELTNRQLLLLSGYERANIA